MVRAVRPDIVHGEYLHVGLSAVAAGLPSVLTLHDVATDVLARRLVQAPPVQRPYRLAELARTRRLERRVVRGVDVPVVLSDTDRARFLPWNARCTTIGPAVAPAPARWQPTGGPPVLVFTGAMWRNANVAAAGFLVDRVLPLVRRSSPSATLRIVGAAPTDEVRAWADLPGVEVTGRVDSLDAEMLRASLVVAPSVLGGGILLKCLNAAALGCPVVTTSAVAASLGFDDGQVRIADGPDAWATAITDLLADPVAAHALGTAARARVTERFTWDHRVAGYLKVYEGVL